MTDTGSNQSRTLETVSRACDVIRALNELNGAGVTELASHLSISKSSAHSYLNTLLEKKFVVKEQGTYRLSLEFLYLGNTVRHRNVLFAHGQSVAENLAAESGEYVHLMCEQHGLERNVYKAKGERAVGEAYHVSKEQHADNLHFTSTGKAVLANLSRSRVEEIIDEYGLVAKTSNTITDRHSLFEELSTIREQGYAFNNEEEIVGIRAVGAPIQGADGELHGAISVSGPANRLTDEFYNEELPKLVTEKANVIEANINMSDAELSL